MGRSMSRTTSSKVRPAAGMADDGGRAAPRRDGRTSWLRRRRRVRSPSGSSGGAETVTAAAVKLAATSADSAWTGSVRSRTSSSSVSFSVSDLQARRSQGQARRRARRPAARPLGVLVARRRRILNRRVVVGNDPPDGGQNLLHGWFRSGLFSHGARRVPQVVRVGIPIPARLRAKPLAAKANPNTVSLAPSETRRG